MTNSELIKTLEVRKEELFKDLSFINGKHEVLINEICYINALLDSLKEDEVNEEDNQTSHAES